MGVQQSGYMYTLERPVDSLPTLVSQLQGRDGWLPAAQTWWFGWCELEMRLPSCLTSVAELPTTWEVVHIFSPRLELRWFRRAQRYQALLLTETELSLGTAQWKSAGSYQVVPTQRILAGEEWQIGKQTVRGSLQFPRQLQYNVADEAKSENVADEAKSEGTKGQILMADVLEYYDDEQRLVTVRYSRIWRQSSVVAKSERGKEMVSHG